MSNYSSALTDINKPGAGYFIPSVNASSMACDQMQENRDALASQLAMWQQKYNSINKPAGIFSNSFAALKDRKDIADIIAIQSDKLNGYISAVGECVSPANTDAPADSNNNHDPNQPADGSAGAPASSGVSGVIDTVKKSKTIQYVLIGLAVIVIGGIVIWGIRKSGKND